jgi:hypothetical protein
VVPQVSALAAGSARAPWCVEQAGPPKVLPMAHVPLAHHNARKWDRLWGILHIP